MTIKKSDKLIYKICRISEWTDAKKNGKFYGTDKDVSDGYIHFSTKKQTRATVKKYFKDQNDIILLEVDVNSLVNLLWEKSRDGLLFPHLYSYLDASSVIGTYEIFIQKDGSYKFPSGF